MRVSFHGVWAWRVSRVFYDCGQRRAKGSLVDIDSDPRRRRYVLGGSCVHSAFLPSLSLQIAALSKGFADFKHLHFESLFSLASDRSLCFKQLQCTSCLVNKTVRNYFTRTLSIFLPTVKICGKKDGNLCEVHSFSTSPNWCHRTTVLNADVPNRITL